VQDFRTRQALEAKSLPNPSSPSPDSASPTTTLQLKRNLSTSAEADTEDGDDGSVNELPKPRTSSLFHLNPPPKKNSLTSHVAGKRRHITPSTASVSQTHTILSDDDSGADTDQVPANLKRA
jgi:hypothetical protein